MIHDLAKLVFVFGLTRAFPANEYNYNIGTSGLSGGNGGILGGALGNDINEPLITKHFYIHAAPEEEGGGVKKFVLGRPQKNYRVVFIKTPAVPKPKYIAEFAPQDEKTVVYVLAQKEQEFDPNDISTPAPTEPSKPEVFFIRYKTPEEAAHAQQQIQAQYDALGGQSQVSDEGTVAVNSVIGILGGQGQSSGSLGLQSSPLGVAAALNNRYLPSNKK